jgi:hypothetical protein
MTLGGVADLFTEVVMALAGPPRSHENEPLEGYFTRVPRRRSLGSRYTGSCVNLPLGTAGTQLSHRRPRTRDHKMWCAE